MAAYLVTYDLIKDKDYTKIINELKRLKAHKALFSAWLVDLDNTLSEVFDHFAQFFIDADDKLVVIKLGKGSIKAKANNGTNAWIRDNL